MFKYIRQGKVSATLGHDGQKQIDLSELIRAFGELKPDTGTSDYSSDSGNRGRQAPATANTSTTTALQLELERLKVHLQFKEAELVLAKERIDELKARELDAKHREREATEERMRMLGVIETQNRLLAAPPIKTAPRPARKTSAAPAKPRMTTKPKAAVVVTAKKATTKAKPKAPSVKATASAKKAAKKPATERKSVAKETPVKAKPQPKKKAR